MTTTQNIEQMDEQQVLHAINSGEDAHQLLLERCPRIDQRWKRMCKSMVDLLADVKEHFPDAEYYTASGGFNLLLGSPHAQDRRLTSQSQLVALNSSVVIGDGDF